MQYNILTFSTFSIFCYFIHVHSYILVPMSTYLLRSDVSNWQCAQNCFNRGEKNSDELDFRRKRSDIIIYGDDYELQVFQHLKAYCSQSLNELRCLESCPTSDVKLQLLELGKNVELLACSNITEAVKAYNCVLKNEDTTECIVENCKKEVETLSLATELREIIGERVIPGEEFCYLENCSHECLKALLPDSCGPTSYLLYRNLSDFANLVQILLAYDEQPRTKHGILCADKPIPDGFEEENNE